MSAASEYNVALVERRFGPAMPDGLDYEDPATVAGDQIASWLHWVASKAAPECVDEAVDEAVANAYRHFEAERGEGDDIAQDSHYYELIAKLP